MENKILLVEDESSIRSFIKVGFERGKYKILEAETGEEGMEIARAQKPDIVIFDIMLQGMRWL